MYRTAVFALLASGVLAAGAARAQAPAQPPICCVPGSPRPDGLRGYADPQYAPPQYGPRPDYDDPAYDPRPNSLGLRGYVGVEYGKSRVEPGTPAARFETWTGEGAVSGQMGPHRRAGRHQGRQC